MSLRNGALVGWVALISLNIDIPTPVWRLGQSPNTSSMPASHPEKLGNPMAMLSPES